MTSSRVTRTIAIIAIPALCLSVGLGARKHRTAVRATLGDGQVLYGEVKTPRLALDSHLGTLHIPLEDVGEVVPVEGEGLGEAGGYVKVWLRDGSELVGRWSEPELAMGIRVGREDVRVDLPMDQLSRLQTQGGELWSNGAVYRVRTSHGDDFLVDARGSTLTLTNDLGEFTPALADCVSVRPIDDPEGDWVVQLTTGTMLIGRVKGNALTLAMTMGPEEVTVPLASFVSMEQQTWARAGAGAARSISPPSHGHRAARGAAKASPSWSEWDEGAAAAMKAGMDVAAAETGAAPVPPTDEEWFERDTLERAKADAR